MAVLCAAVQCSRPHAFKEGHAQRCVCVCGGGGGGGGEV